MSFTFSIYFDGFCLPSSSHVRDVDFHFEHVELLRMFSHIFVHLSKLLPSYLDATHAFFIDDWAETFDKLKIALISNCLFMRVGTYPLTFLISIL